MRPLEGHHALLAATDLHLDHGCHGFRELVSMALIQRIDLTDTAIKGGISLSTPFPCSSDWFPIHVRGRHSLRVLAFFGQRLDQPGL